MNVGDLFVCLCASCNGFATVDRDAMELFFGCCCSDAMGAWVTVVIVTL